MTSDEIREGFLRYFESKGHQRVASSSLIPVGDPTLLLTTAGMVQFKPYFAGDIQPPNKRLTSSQKSFRTVDIDEVGDRTHLTFFEMLGNFSIGDYFKDEAMEFALGCLEDVMGLPRDRFAATVHQTDDEAYDLWSKHGIPDGRIFRFGDADNWWGPAGNEGPTGPCAELHYDFQGERPGCGLNNCGPNCTNIVSGIGEVCQRYVELWNLVFMQYYHNLDGSRPLLPNPGIDTGLGLERLVTVKQNAQSFYETDLFLPLIESIEQASGKSYQSSLDVQYSMRVVAEHSRSAAFLIADGVAPSNEGRGYVLRRVLRRAIRHGRDLGLEGEFLGGLAGGVIDQMCKTYPELSSNRQFVETVLTLEEQRFEQAFQNGYAVLTHALKESETLGGDVAFRLWDTYGFPVEMTQEIAREYGMNVDIVDFEAHMENQRRRGRDAGQFTDDRVKVRTYEKLGVGSTRFLGYEQLLAHSVIVGIIANGDMVDEVKDADSVEVILSETPFYSEGGGQVGDVGQINGPDGNVTVNDTRAVMPGLIVHFGVVSSGKLQVGDKVEAVVDNVRREDTARNHTATHMLHAALRQVLGSHVRQAGSLVAADRLRFDFSHVEPMTDDEVKKVQWLVNERIRHNVGVHKSEDKYTSAIARGALAFFGDKYEDTVRLVEIANGEAFSFEVCGGTHVERTGELGAVYILGESSIGSGMRRIEAVSGRAAEMLVGERFAVQDRIAGILQVPLNSVEVKLNALIEEIDELRHDKEAFERRELLYSSKDLLNLVQDVDGVSVIAQTVDAPNSDGLREMGDWLRDKMNSGVVALGAVVNNQPVLVIMVTSDLVKRGLNASEIAKSAAKTIGGGGGGRPDVAQAGGRIVEKLDDAIDTVPELVRSTDLVS